jgi:hypothetical protein
MGHFGCHRRDQSGSRGNGKGTAIAVDAREWGGGRSWRASGAVMGEWSERQTHLLCFLVSVSGAVGTDTMGQVISCVYGGWLGDDGGGGGRHCQGWCVRVWGEGVWGGCGLA